MFWIGVAVGVSICMVAAVVSISAIAWSVGKERAGFDVANEWAETGNLEAAIGPRKSRPSVPELKWLHAIPNGGARGDDERSRAIRGGQLKAEGVTPTYAVTPTMVEGG